MRDAESRRIERVFARRLLQESRLLFDSSKYIIEESRKAIARARAIRRARALSVRSRTDDV